MVFPICFSTRFSSRNFILHLENRCIKVSGKKPGVICCFGVSDFDCKCEDELLLFDIESNECKGKAIF